MNEDYLEKLRLLEAAYAPYIKIMEEKLSKERMLHIKGCVKEVYLLAQHFGVDVRDSMIAALFHDFFRESSEEEIFDLVSEYNLSLTKEEQKIVKVLHGKMASEYLKRQELKLPATIYEAIESHTLAKVDLGDVGKILYLADAIEETRSYENVGFVREYVYNHNLDEAYLYILKETITSTLKKNKYLFSKTINAYNREVEKQHDRNGKGQNS